MTAYIIDESGLSKVESTYGGSTLTKVSDTMWKLDVTVTKNDSYNIAATDKSGNRATDNVRADWFNQTVSADASANAPTLLDSDVGFEKSDGSGVTSVLPSGEHAYLDGPDPAAPLAPSASMFFRDSEKGTADFTANILAESDGRYPVTANGYYQYLITDDDGSWSRVIVQMDKISVGAPQLLVGQDGNTLQYSIVKTYSKEVIKAISVNDYTLPVAEKGQFPITHNGVYTFKAVGDESGLPVTINVVNLNVSIDDGSLTVKNVSSFGKSDVTVTATFRPLEDGEHNCPSKKFTDVDVSLWYHEALDYVISAGLMNGVSDTLFQPNGTTTRGQIVTILYRLEGQPAVTGASPFDDVLPGKYYTEAVIWVNRNEIVTGYGDGKFGPNDQITREQMAAILYRYAKYKGQDVSQSADLSSFKDLGLVSSYALTPIGWANAKGLINGVTADTLEPQSGATRCQLAAILYRFDGLDK